MQRHKSAVTMRDISLLLCTLSVIAHARGSTNMTDEVLHTEDNHCQPILVNGELMPTVPEYMPSFPVSLKGIKRHFVCKLSASNISLEATTYSISDSTIPNPTTTTKSTTAQGTTTMSTTESTTSHPTTTTQMTAKMFVTSFDGIFVADLQDDLNFTSIPSTDRPDYITYDSVENKIYWGDQGTQLIYRADEDGGNREEVTSGNGNDPRGIAIAESSRILYIAYDGAKKITTMDIGQGSRFPGNESNFVTGLTNGPFSLEVDEEQGFLYWSCRNKILLKPLNGSGSMETVYLKADLDKITGLSIDLNRDPRRFFFCDSDVERSFYMDVNPPLTMAHELTDYMNDTDIDDDEERKYLHDIGYFDGTLYWTKRDSPKGIAVMTNYDQTSPSFEIKEISEIDEPRRLVITK